MGEKNETKVEIAGRVYTVSGSEDTAYMNQVAAYVNQKLEEIQQVKGFKRMSKQYQELLIYLNIADDYFKVKDKNLNSNEIARMEEEAYQLKCELVDMQMKFSQIEADTQEQKALLQTELEQRIEAYEAMNKENADLKQQLETNQQEYEEKIENLRRRLQSFQDKFHEIEKEVAQKDAQLQEQSTKLQEQNIQLQEQNMQLQEQGEQLADMEAAVDAKVKQREEDCEARCVRRDEAWREKLTKAERQLEEMRQALAEAAADAGESEEAEEVEKLKRMLELSQDEQLSMMEEIEEYQEQIQELQEQLQSLKSEA